MPPQGSIAMLAKRPYGTLRDLLVRQELPEQAPLTREQMDAIARERGARETWLDRGMGTIGDLLSGLIDPTGPILEGQRAQDVGRAKKIGMTLGALAGIPGALGMAARGARATRTLPMLENLVIGENGRRFLRQADGTLSPLPSFSADTVRGTLRISPPPGRELGWAEYSLDGKRLQTGTDAFTTPRPEQLKEWDSLAPELARRVREVGQKRVFIRFGHPPKSGVSMNHATGQPEKGVSVFPAEVDPLTGAANFIEDGTGGSAHIAAAFGGYGNKAYLVSGEVVGRGSDGEPVLRNLKVLERITYDPKRQGFVPAPNRAAQR
jgi:hypothetical protein